MDKTLLADRFAAALPYDAYLATATEEQRVRWKGVYDIAAITAPQRDLVASFTRRMNLLVVSGAWCGDCVQQCPLVEHIAQANREHLDLRFIDRDANRTASPAFADFVRINGGDRVPTLLLMSEDFELCGFTGDRTLTRYRAIARKQLGASCATGIGAPDLDEMAATLQDWLNEIERIQLMLRTSARLRQKHGD